jgi:hypothetical protein
MVPPPLELLPPDAPPSLGPGELQTMTGSDGSTASGPHESPADRHSTAVAHSWMAPMGVEGHGPAWQFVVMVIAPQQIWPLGQTAAFVHATPLLLLPPLLALSPPDELLLLDTPPLDDEPVPPASVEPPLLVPLWPVPLNANGLPTTSRELRSPQPRANARSTIGSSLPKFIALLGSSS